MKIWGLVESLVWCSTDQESHRRISLHDHRSCLAAAATTTSAAVAAAEEASNALKLGGYQGGGCSSTAGMDYGDGLGPRSTETGRTGDAGSWLWTPLSPVLHVNGWCSGGWTCQTTTLLRSCIFLLAKRMQSSAILAEQGKITAMDLRAACSWATTTAGTLLTVWVAGNALKQRRGSSIFR